MIISYLLKASTVPINMDQEQKTTEPIIKPVPVVNTDDLFQPDPEPPIPPRRKLPSKTVMLFIGIFVFLGIVITGSAVMLSWTKRIPEESTSHQQTDQRSDSNEQVADEAVPVGTQVAPDTQSSADTAPGTPSAVPSPSPSPPPAPQPVTAKTYTIKYTNSCYTPAGLTIKKGDSVVFKNESSKFMWPATDDHPAHDEYPEFDSKSGIAPGNSYSFTFNRMGTWAYHDHNKPGCTGAITVQ